MSTITVSGLARKAKGRGEERREEILAASERLFAQRGVHAVTTREIAEAVGVSQASLYAYFPSRTELLEQVSARAFGQLRAAAVASFCAGGSFEAAIRAYIRFGLEHPDAYRIAFMLETRGEAPPAEPSPAKRGPGMGAFDTLRQVMTTRLGQGHPEVEAAAQSLWAAMHGLVSLMLARPGFPWIGREALIETHVRMLSRGFPAA